MCQCGKNEKKKKKEEGRERQENHGTREGEKKVSEMSEELKPEASKSN